MTRLLAWAAIAILATYATMVGGAWAGIYTPSLRLLSMLLAGIGLAVWWTVAIRYPGWRPRSVLMPAILAALGSLAISTVFSRDARVSIEYLGYAVVLAALYLLLVRLFAHPYFAARLPTLAATLFGIISIAFLALVAAHLMEWWTLVGRITVPPLRPDHEGLTFLNPSAVLTMVVLLAVPAVALLAAPTRRGLGAVIAIGVVVAAVALLSGSRAGWLALALTFLIMAIAWLASPARRRAAVATVFRVAARRSGQIAIVGAVLIVALGAVAFGPAVIARASEGGETLRTTYVASALRMFAEAPLLGTGPGTWVIQREAYTAATEPDYFIPHAHNLEAQTLAELGVVGAIAGIVVAVGLLRLLLGGIRDGSPVRRRWAWATAAGLIYVGLHQQLDFYANMPAVLFAVALPVAYLDGTSSERTSSAAPTRRWYRPMLRRPIAILGAAAVGVAVVGLAVQELPAMRMAVAVDREAAGDWQGVDDAARSAADFDPAIGTYQLMAGLGAAATGDHERAVAAFEKVTAASDLPEAWLDLAAERALTGDSEGAVAALNSALRLGIQRPAVAIPAGDLALRLGQTETARAAFEAAIRTTPSIAGDGWWRLDPKRADVFAAALEEAVAGTQPYVAWEIALLADDTDRAHSLAKVGGLDGWASPIIDAWAGSATATAIVEERCHTNPFDVASLSWCARIASRQGDLSLATRWRRMSEILIGGASLNGGELRVATSTARVTGAGNPALFWATFTYRRPGPSDLLVPSLAHLTLG